MNKLVPNRIMTLDGESEVVSVNSFPPGKAPAHSPIKREYHTICVVTENHHVRWFGFTNAFINSSLRMEVSGVNPLDEVLMKWEDAK